MTKITPFAFPVLEEIIKRKRLLSAFLQQFPAIAEHIGEHGFKDRREAIKALSQTDWLPWVERVWMDLEDLAQIVSKFGPLAEDRSQKLAQYAPEKDKEKIEQRTKETKSQMEVQGPRIWKWLHEMALGWNGEKDDLQSIISMITNAVPCGECKKHWVEMLVAHPPKATNAEEFFAESVAWHNQVNARLGKPELTVEDARKIYAHAG